MEQLVREDFKFIMPHRGEPLEHSTSGMEGRHAIEDHSMLARVVLRGVGLQIVEFQLTNSEGVSFKNVVSTWSWSVSARMRSQFRPEAVALFSVRTVPTSATPTHNRNNTSNNTKPETGHHITNPTEEIVASSCGTEDHLRSSHPDNRGNPHFLVLPPRPARAYQRNPRRHGQ